MQGLSAPRNHLILALALLAGCAHTPDAVLPVRNECLYSLDKHSFSSVPFEPVRLDGQVVLVTFVASWCFPCLTEVPVLNRLQKELGPKGFQSVLVMMDLEGGMTVEPFVAAQEEVLLMPVVLPTEPVRTGESPFGKLRELPVRYLFGRDGTLKLAYTGVGDPADLKRALEKELSAGR